MAVLTRMILPARGLAAAWLTVLAGCAFLPVEHPATDRGPATVKEHPDTPRPPVAESAATTTDAQPGPRPRRDAGFRLALPRVVVLLPPDISGFELTLDALESQLNARGFPLERIATIDAAAQAALLGSESLRPTYVIAVGNEAARIAAEELRLPMVFCQISEHDYDSLVDASGEVRGVAALPPLALQLRAWKLLDPNLKRVALILSSQRADLAEQAHEAAAALSLTLDYRVASTDQEALYLFKRLAQNVDGLWLLPDNAILSPRVIREMLDYAGSHRMQSLVFAPALLEWGGLLSVSSTSANLAWTLADVVERLANGQIDELAPITPLSELEVQINELAAKRLGLRPLASGLIVRSGS